VAWFIGQSFVFIAIAFVLGVLVGWLWWGRPGRVAAPALAAATATASIIAVERPTAVALTRPAATPAPEPETTPAPEAEPESQPEAETQPEAEAEPEPAAAVARDDDLERIEGIGPKMSAALRAAGIRTYAALAGSDEATLRAAIERAGMSFAPSIVTWARQARLLADGDEEGFADLARRLVAGREVGRS